MILFDWLSNHIYLLGCEFLVIHKAISEEKKLSDFKSAGTMSIFLSISARLTTCLLLQL